MQLHPDDPLNFLRWLPVYPHWSTAWRIGREPKMHGYGEYSPAKVRARLSLLIQGGLVERTVSASLAPGVAGQSSQVTLYRVTEKGDEVRGSLGMSGGSCVVPDALVEKGHFDF